METAEIQYLLLEQNIFHPASRNPGCNLCASLNQQVRYLRISLCIANSWLCLLTKGAPHGTPLPTFPGELHGNYKNASPRRPEMVHFLPKTRGMSNGVPRPASGKQSQSNEKPCWWGSLSPGFHTFTISRFQTKMSCPEKLSALKHDWERSPYPLRRKSHYQAIRKRRQE